MAQRAFWHVAIGAACLAAGASRSAPQQSAECRTIPDAAARLACYDRQNGILAPSPGAPASRVPQAVAPAPAPMPAPVQVASPPPSPPSTAASEPPTRTTFDSRITRVTAIRHGLHRIDLEDGSAWNMTVAEQPPEIGEAVHFRRTPLGTRFFDIRGRRPISVRPSR